MPTRVDAFSTVFASAVLPHSTPTPLATPLLGAGDFGPSYRSLASPAKQHSTIAQSLVRHHLAWSTATRYLSLDGTAIAGVDESPGTVPLRPHKTREVEQAIDLLLSEDGHRDHANDEVDLTIWYIDEVRKHFLSNVGPRLLDMWAEPIPLDEVHATLERTIEILSCSQDVYQSRLQEDILPAIHEPQGGSLAKDSQRHRKQARIQQQFQNKLHAVFLQALPSQRLAGAISHHLWEMTAKVFQFGEEHSSRRTPRISQPPKSEQAYLDFLAQLQAVGLGDDFGQRALAHAIWQVTNDFVSGHWMKVDWGSQRTRVKTLTRWANHGLAPFVQRSIQCLGGTDDKSCQWESMTSSLLGRLRVANLFEYAVQWPMSTGAVRDIKGFITTPEARLFLTTNFSDQVERRLLHAGATTTHILNVYINIIGAFNELDSKGVLLDRVAKPVRKYLKLREDTARIIVTSLLADLTETDDGYEVGEDVSLEIAKEMAKPISGVDRGDQVDLDFDNMDWTPDPIDVSPEFRRMKSQDVITALLTLYERDDFINELKTILGEHLLRNYNVNEHYEKEERLLELFKNRLGDDKLQACEVMLRDVQASRQMNKAIHRFPPYVKSQSQLGTIGFNTHILSSYFWPSLKDDDFKIPAPIAQLQSDFEKGFEAVKDMRKLQWLRALGRVTVELELEDRRVEEEVPPWSASVIYAFQSVEDATSPTRTVDDLSNELEMEEPLVRSALQFWQAKSVLRETSPGSNTFIVIENLSSEATTLVPPPILPAEDPIASAVKSQADLLNENADLYKNIIVNMLTNQGKAPLMRITMMLKAAAGFPFGADEVRQLCGMLIDEGKCVGQGDVFAVRKG